MRLIVSMEVLAISRTQNSRGTRPPAQIPQVQHTTEFETRYVGLDRRRNECGVGRGDVGADRAGRTRESTYEGSHVDKFELSAEIGVVRRLYRGVRIGDDDRRSDLWLPSERSVWGECGGAGRGRGEGCDGGEAGCERTGVTRNWDVVSDETRWR